MGCASGRAALEGARSEIAAVGAEFSRVARPTVAAALRRRLDAFLQAHDEWFAGLDSDVATELQLAADRAIDQAAADVERRLVAEELWLDPKTAPGVLPRPHDGWEGWVPEWISGLLRRFSRGVAPPSLADLDDPGNRAWVALLSAAKPLDPVLQEFGLVPSAIPALGGGHYGLQPRTAAELDPSGELVRLWRRYRQAYGRFAALAPELGPP